MEVGDIGLLLYSQKYGEEKFRLCKVVEVFLDGQGKVRTVRVAVRDKRRAARERANQCQAGVVFMEVAIQRIVVILPAGEAWAQGVPQ